MLESIRASSSKNCSLVKSKLFCVNIILIGKLAVTFWGQFWELKLKSTLSMFLVPEVVSFIGNISLKG